VLEFFALPASGAVAVAGTGGAVAATGAGDVRGAGGKVSDPLVPQAPSAMPVSKASTRCCRIGQSVNKSEPGMVAQDE
jgi:hypothetical protein